ncbi:unnamed protein product [Closterium sp. Yama58-4]|nr:unnamed protein product [Closterium sp. Yama58-4]
MSSTIGTKIKHAMLKEPVVMWSCIIAGIGMALPVIVPPMRDALSPSKPVAQPKTEEVIRAITGQSR